MTIRQLIAEGESDVFEFKTSFGKDVIETLCAFANHRGGTVLIGVADDRKIVGTSCGSESLQAWANEVKQNTTPSIIPDVETISVRGKTVVLLRVSEFPVKPVAFRDRYFKRVANSNHRIFRSRYLTPPSLFSIPDAFMGI
jgi:ATP-dependent DNA helicase RecG